LIGPIVTYPAAYDAGLILTSRTQHRGYVVAVLRGELDLASAPVLRQQLASLLRRPAASRLIIDLPAVRSADASGLAVLVGSGRRAGLLGGFLRLARPAICSGGYGHQVRLPDRADPLSRSAFARISAERPNIPKCPRGQRPEPAGVFALSLKIN
jgi:anti-anti-sigma factor